MHYFYLKKYFGIHENAFTITQNALILQLLGEHRPYTSLPIRSTQPCIPPGSLNRVPASAGVRAGMSPLPGGR